MIPSRSTPPSRRWRRQIEFALQALHTRLNRMSHSSEVKADTVLAAANLGLLILIAIGGLIKFAWIDRSLANLERDKITAEIETATRPILAVTPRLMIGPELAKQFRAVKLSVAIQNIGNGSLALGTVSVQVSQAQVPKNIALRLLEAAKRKPEEVEAFQSPLESTEIYSLSRNDLQWTPLDDTLRKYALNSTLLSKQKAQFTADYVLEPSSQPHFVRYEVMIAPPEDVSKELQWEPKTADLIAGFGPLPYGFGEAEMGPIWPGEGPVYTVSSPRSRSSDVQSDGRGDLIDTLPLVPIEIEIAHEDTTPDQESS